MQIKCIGLPRFRCCCVCATLSFSLPTSGCWVWVHHLVGATSRRIYKFRLGGWVVLFARPWWGGCYISSLTIAHIYEQKNCSKLKHLKTERKNNNKNIDTSIPYYNLTKTHISFETAQRRAECCGSHKQFPNIKWVKPGDKCKWFSQRAPSVQLE